MGCPPGVSSKKFGAMEYLSSAETAVLAARARMAEKRMVFRCMVFLISSFSLGNHRTSARKDNLEKLNSLQGHDIFFGKLKLKLPLVVRRSAGFFRSALLPVGTGRDIPFPSQKILSKGARGQSNRSHN